LTIFGTSETIKLTVKLRAVIFTAFVPLPLTVIIAEYIPAGKPGLGLTVKLKFPVISGIVDVFIVKPEGFELVIINASVDCPPVFVIVTVNAAGWLYGDTLSPNE
jgi:hypothetical protein